MSYLTIRSIATAAVLALLGSASSVFAAADHILVNAKAYTLNETAPWAEAVAIEGDHIVYVGDNAGAIARADADTLRHDLQGQMLLPGFIDAHMHPISGGGYAKALSLNTWGTVDEWIVSIEQYAVDNPGDGLLFGYGFLATTFGPQGPTRQQIDAIVPDRPVLIMDEGFHGAWANTLALEALGIDQDTADPAPGFSYYKRDESGYPTGYLLEGTANQAMDDLEAITLPVLIDGTEYVIDVLNSYGVTSIYDAGVMEGPQYINPILSELENKAQLSVRIVGSHFAGGPDDTENAVAAAIEQGKRVKGERYHYNTLKIMLDGTVEGRTAAMFEDYQGEPGNQGELVFSQDQTNTKVVGAAKAEIDVHIHGLGERAVHVALNAIEAARKAHPDSETRYTICHVQLFTDEDLPRFAALDVIVQSTPLWASYDLYGKAFVSDDQFTRFWRFRSLQQAGVTLTWGSDYPASGAGLLGMSPVVQMQIGMTRQNLNSPDGPIQPPASERLELPELIRGYTLSAAHQLHMEDRIGSLEVGKKADLVVLEKNLFDVPTQNIHEVQVTRTFVDGELVFMRE